MTAARYAACRLLPPLSCPLFAALCAQIHALNLLCSLLAVSPEAASFDVLPAAVTADAALRSAQLGPPAPPVEPSESTEGVKYLDIDANHNASLGSRYRAKAEARDAGLHMSGTPVPFAVAALAVAIRATASREFPVRSAANSLQVAATKRLAGTDDEVGDETREHQQERRGPP